MNSREYLSDALGSRQRERGSILIIVMWICLGLVALTLYFANSMSSELRSADNRTLEVTTRQAVEGGMRYAAYVLTNFATNGTVPDPTIDYKSENLPVGTASFWFIGRDPNVDANTQQVNQPVFNLVDEASKLNLNVATSAMLQNLPGMTPDLAQAIISWRNTQTQASGSSADNTYATLDPPRLNKGAPFESVDELRLVYGMSLDLLFGEDYNRNGALDTNEDDGDQSAPHDNQDGLLQPGFVEYLTIYSKLPTTQSVGGARRINITTPQLRQATLRTFLTTQFGQQRGVAIFNAVGTRTFGSVAEFMAQSQMTSDEYDQVHTAFTAGLTTDLVNVNTASATVLACIPGIGTDGATQITTYRQSHTGSGTTLKSFGWLAQVLPRASLVRAGPYITDQSYAFSADIAAVGPSGRGYCREKVVFDMSTGTPRVVYHQDLSSYGWALGSQVRQNLKAPKDT